MLNSYAKTELELMVGKDEKILWQGKPDKQCFVLEGMFNPLLPFAFLWGLVDLFFIIAAITDPGTKETPIKATLAILLIGLFHMMPVWIYLAGALFVFRRYRHTEYIVTDKAIYTSGGLFSYTCKMKPFTELARVSIHRGIIDQFIGVGDVTLKANNTDDIGVSSGAGSLTHNAGIIISDIRNYREVFSIIKKLQEDIYTDALYPNDLRPKENHGYKTKYKGLD